MRVSEGILRHLEDESQKLHLPSYSTIDLKKKKKKLSISRDFSHYFFVTVSSS